MHSLQAKAWNVIYSMVKQGTQTCNRQMRLERTRTFLPFDYILPLNCLVTVRLPKMARACINIKNKRLFIRARPLCLLVTKYHASLKKSYNIQYITQFTFYPLVYTTGLGNNIHILLLVFLLLLHNYYWIWTKAIILYGISKWLQGIKQEI